MCLNSKAHWSDSDNVAPQNILGRLPINTIVANYDFINTREAAP